MEKKGSNRHRKEASERYREKDTKNAIKFPIGNISCAFSLLSRVKKGVAKKEDSFLLQAFVMQIFSFAVRTHKGGKGSEKHQKSGIFSGAKGAPFPVPSFRKEMEKFRFVCSHCVPWKKRPLILKFLPIFLKFRHGKEEREG